MRDILKILLFLGAILTCGAILAAPLYWLGQWAAHTGVLPVLAKFSFQKYFNRSLLISAIGLLWPFGKWIGVNLRWQETFPREEKPVQRALEGFALGALIMGMLAAICVLGGFYVPKHGFGFSVLVPAFFSACFVGILEEWLFRGAITALLTRSYSQPRAIWLCSGIFAAVHFLKPNPAFQIAEVKWYSGWLLIPEMFHQFNEPSLVMGGFGTLLLLGWVLGLAAWRTRSLWMSIGLHAGVVLLKLSFTRAFERRSHWTPWLGTELQVGLVPVFLLLITGLFFLFWPPGLNAKESL